jgi:uroporphyrinogen-III synthase
MRVLILRPEPQASRMVAAFAGRGIEAVAAPLLEIVPEPAAARRVLEPSGTPDALVFTSVHAVAALAADPRCAELLGVPVFAVGPATAAAAREAGFAQVAAAGGQGEQLVAHLLAELPVSATVVHATGRDMARDVAGLLAAAGRPARSVTVYRAEAAERLPPAVEAEIASARFDVAVIGSRRTAAVFVAALGRMELPLPLEKPAAVAISAAAAAPLEGAIAHIVVSPAPDGDALLEAAVALGATLANNAKEQRA